jgi:hypothetical protein
MMGFTGVMVLVSAALNFSLPLLVVVYRVWALDLLMKGQGYQNRVESI